MTYPFVKAKWFTPGAITEYRAIVIHMAEGGGTVSWLTHPPSDVSASHVIEYSGRIVQMVQDGDASHCQHTSPEPYGTANYGIYSATTGHAVLGDGWSNVNRYVFAIEMEGFRATGPNAAQKASLKELVADLRARHTSIRGLLGHRDVQDKPCPGAYIPWADIGGHGLFKEDTDIDPKVYAPVAKATIASGGTLYGDEAKTKQLVSPWAGGTNVGVYAVGPILTAILYDTVGGPGQNLVIGWIGTNLVTLTTGDTAAASLAARRAEWDRIKNEARANLTLPPRP